MRGTTWDVVLDAAGNREFADVRRVLNDRGVMVSTRLSPQDALDIVTKSCQVVFAPS